MGTDREPQALQWASSLEGIDSASLREIVDVDPVSLQKIVTAIAAAQKTLRSERSRTGLVAARQRGQRLGRPPAMTETQIALARRMMAEGVTRKIIARTLKVSRSTLYIALKARPTASKPHPHASERAPPAAPKSFLKRNKHSPRTSFALLAALLLPLLLFFALPAAAQTAGGACATTGIETAGEEGVMVCNSSDVWELAMSWSATSSYGYIVPNIGNDSGSCTTAKTGELIYNGAAFEYCSGTAWTSFGTNLNNVDVELAAGSAAAPSLSFYADTNTGMYQASSGGYTINFTSDGTEIAAFDSTGDFNLTNGVGGTSAGAYQINNVTVLALPDKDATSIAVGQQALQRVSASPAYDVGIGYQALQSDSSANDNNVAIGANALQYNTGYGYDVAIGNSALYSDSSTLGFNVAIGYGTVASVTGGFDVGIGYDALGDDSGGGNNVAIGVNTLAVASSAGQDVAIGSIALATDSSTRGNNVAVGAGALVTNTGAGYDVAIGSGALSSDSSLNGYNTAVGSFAMAGASASVLTGSYDTALGSSALYDMQGAAADNTAVGYASGYSLTTGTDNTLIGYESGYGVKGSHNIILGEDPSSAITTGSSNILIGNSLSNVTNSSNKQLDIGDLIMGSISGSTPEVGIGTRTYQGQGLTVSGDVWATIFQMTSDARLKTDIRPLSDALGRIAQVKGVTYEWKPPEAREIGKDMSLPLNQPQMGVLAQDVEAAFPEAVTTGPNGLKSVNYESLAAPLIEAVKTLKRQNEVPMAAVGLLYVGLVALTALFAALAVLFLTQLRRPRTP